MTRWSFVAVVLSLGCGLGAGPGCKKSEDPGPPCAKVADHVLEVTARAFPGHGDMSGGGSRKAYIDGCESRKMPADERRCLLEAQDMLSLARCRKLPPGARPPNRPTTPPAGSAGSAGAPAGSAAAPAGSAAAPAGSAAAPAGSAAAPAPAPAPTTGPAGSAAP